MDLFLGIISDLVEALAPQLLEADVALNSSTTVVPWFVFQPALLIIRNWVMDTLIDLLTQAPNGFSYPVMLNDIRHRVCFVFE
jgi:hypothetical protein